MNVAIDLVGIAQHRVLSRTRGFWEHIAPVIGQFPHTYAELRQAASASLPGMRWRLPLFRYAVTWRKPAQEAMHPPIRPNRFAIQVLIDSPPAGDPPAGAAHLRIMDPSAGSP